jgi:HK97 family phage major capsid protein
MAITTHTSGLVFSSEEASEILTKAQQGSFVMQLGREVALPGSGIDYQVVTDGNASFVDEGACKPEVEPKLDKKTMVPHKIAVIIAVSDELMEDRPALINHLTSRLPEQFARGIDTEVCKAGKLANFGYLGDAEAVSVADMYEGLVTAEYNIGKEQYQLDNLVFSAKAKKQLRDAKDNTGRPIFDN